ncbi:MAG: HigA family addiction module antitoxin [Clostridia bacterium]|nr:HigA family addiction module antitoxin [Clostridia bacterium]
MTEKGAGLFEYVPRMVTPPGSTLLETIKALGMTQAELAQRMGRPIKTVNEIIKGKAAITLDTALQLERVLGVPAHFWRAREEQYQQYLLGLKDNTELSAQREWLKQIPITELVKRGWVVPGASVAERVRAGLEYFGVASVEAWRQVWAAPDAAYRRSLVFDANPGAVAAWLRKGEIDARVMECERYRRRAFVSALGDIRSLTLEQPKASVLKAQLLCAQAGVALVFVPELSKCRASGATRWLNRHKAMIQLSLRYKTNDHLWFTFFHEAGHLLHGAQGDTFVDEPDLHASADEAELLANQFAADTLIPPSQYRTFAESLNRGWVSRDEVFQFARSIGIDPGIVVGRLQHEGLLAYRCLNDLKVHLQWPNELE